MPCTMLSPGRTVVIDCETTDLPGALAVVVSLPRGLAKPGHSLARPRRQAGNWNRSGPPTPRNRCQKLQGMPRAVSRPSRQALLPGEWRTHRSRTSGAWLRGTSGHSGNTARAILRHSKRQVVEAIDRRRPTSRGVVGQPRGLTFGDTFVGTSWVSPTRDRYPRRGSPNDDRNRSPHPASGTGDGSPVSHFPDHRGQRRCLRRGGC